MNQITIFIERDTEKVKFEERGRIEDEEESRLFGERLEKYLNEKGANYVKVKGSDAAIDTALKVIEEREKQKKNEA